MLEVLELPISFQEVMEHWDLDLAKQYVDNNRLDEYIGFDEEIQYANRVDDDFGSDYLGNARVNKSANHKGYPFFHDDVIFYYVLNREMWDWMVKNPLNKNQTRHKDKARAEVGDLIQITNSGCLDQRLSIDGFKGEFLVDFVDDTTIRIQISGQDQYLDHRDYKVVPITEPKKKKRKPSVKVQGKRISKKNLITMFGGASA